MLELHNQFITLLGAVKIRYIEESQMLANENKVAALLEFRKFLEQCPADSFVAKYPKDLIAMVDDVLAATSQPASLDAEYGELRALAEKATPGSWTTQCGDEDDLNSSKFKTDFPVRVMAVDDCEHHAIADCSTSSSCRLDYEQADNAAWIAAANPAAILAILDSRAQFHDRHPNHAR